MRALVFLAIAFAFSAPAAAFKPTTHVAFFEDGPRTVAAALGLEAGFAHVTLVRGDGSVVLAELPAGASMGASHRFRAVGVGRLVWWDCAGEAGVMTCALAELEGEAFGPSVADDAPLVTVDRAVFDGDEGGVACVYAVQQGAVTSFAAEYDDALTTPSHRPGIILDHTGAGLVGDERWVPMRAARGAPLVDLAADRVAPPSSTSGGW